MKSWVIGGGRNESSRAGGFVNSRADGQPFRFDRLDAREIGSSCDVAFSSKCRSVEAKFRAAGVRGGVDSPEDDGRMIVFLQRSQTPEEYVIGCWQLLQVATAFDVTIGALRNLKS
jgi:hypothetical protein